MLNFAPYRELHIKPTMSYYLTLVRMAIFKNSTNSKCWREYEKKKKYLTLLVGMQTGIATMESIVEIP